MNTVFIADKDEYICKTLHSRLCGVSVERIGLGSVTSDMRGLFVNADCYGNISAQNMPSDVGIILLSGRVDENAMQLVETFGNVFFSIDALIEYIQGRTCLWDREYFLQLRNRAELYLRYIGMKEKLCGFKYIAFLTAYLTLTKDASMKYEIFPQMCDYFKKSEGSIERAMRYAVEETWNSGNIFAQQKIFGYSVSPQRGKPVTREFAAMISEKIRDDICT